MKPLQGHETVLTGRWVRRGDRIVADETCERINDLVRTHLLKLGADKSGWDNLFRDPDDGRLWELLYPQSEMHGGGPPELRVISPEDATRKYGDLATSRT